MLLHVGEVWIVEGRKGRLTVKLLEEVDTEQDCFFQAQLVEGVPKYLSRGAEPDELGEEMSFRTTLTQFIERTDKIEL